MQWPAHAPTYLQSAWIQALRLSPPWLRRPLQRHFHEHVEPNWESPLDVAVRGVKYRCNYTDNIAEYKLLFQGRRFDAWHLAHLRPYLQNAGVFVDIGANFGFFSLNAAKMMPATGTVVAVEPNPVMASRLRTNIAINGCENIEVVEAAVGPTAGRAVRKGNLTDHGGAQYCNDDVAEQQGERVDMMPLVDIVTSAGCNRIDVLKIDVEGAEDEALLPLFQSAPADVWPKVVAIEDSCKQLWSVDVLAQLAEFGYRLIAKGRSDQILKRD